MKLTDVVDGVKTIQSANLNNDGRYECLAKNSIGNVSASFNFTVNGKICVKTVLVHIYTCLKTNTMKIKIIKIIVLVKIQKRTICRGKIYSHSAYDYVNNTRCPGI